MKKGIFKNCLKCKEPFYVYPYLVDSPVKGKYCGKACLNLDKSRVAKAKGYGLWTRGKITSKEVRQKQSAALKGRLPKNFYDMQKLGGFSKNNIPWNKGTTGLIKPNRGSFKIGQVAPNFGKKLPSIQGEKHHNWKGGITIETRKQRDRFHKYFTPRVFKRDDYTCQLCKARGVVLQVDHIKKWADYLELRFDLTNCRTLCRPCHYFITFGKPLTDKYNRFGNWK